MRNFQKASVMFTLTTCIFGPFGFAEGDPFGKVTMGYSSAEGIGLEDGVMRRDPSDIIKIGELYFVWYSEGPIKTGYDATVWYATSPDGCQWTEKGVAVGKGAPLHSAVRYGRAVSVEWFGHT